jgi:UTP--glucose-1-phosphate uridylyltransferase
MTKVKTAIFPVGGLGTRFLPATKSMPKEMLPIVDKPLIHRAFEEAKAAGIEKFIFITGRNKNIIANHFDHAYELQKELENKQKKEVLALTKDWVPSPGSIAFIRQQHTIGLGHAVLCAKNYVNEPFAVLLADELFVSEKPVMKQMVEAYENNPSPIIAVQEIDKENSEKYGIIKVKSEAGGGLINIDSMVEKPDPEDAPSNLSICGRYILDPEIFDYLETQGEGSGGEIQLTDAMNRMAQKRQVNAYKVIGDRYDCGNRKGFLEANIAFALNTPGLKDNLAESIKTLLKKYS